MGHSLGVCPVRPVYLHLCSVTCPDNVPLCPDCPATPHLADLDPPIERVGMGETKVVGFGLYRI